MRFGHVNALTSISVAVQPGITGLIGANGAGKTTLMATMLGIARPSSGSIRTLGLDPTAQRTKVSQLVGFVPERNVMPDDTRAVDYVTHLARVRGLPKRAAKQAASDALFLVGIGEERVRPLGTMSTGQRQRIKVAQAIAASPRLILLDEPTAGLDPTQRSSMLHMITSIHAQADISFLLSSHLLDEVEQICQQIIVLNSGELIAAGSMQDVFRLTSNEYRIEFAEQVDTAQLHAIGRRIAAAVPGASFRDLPGALDPTLVIRPDPATPPRTVANACRDAIAIEQRRIRFLGPNRRNLLDVFEESTGTQPAAVSR